MKPPTNINKHRHKKLPRVSLIDIRDQSDERAASWLFEAFDEDGPVDGCGIDFEIMKDDERCPGVIISVEQMRELAARLTQVADHLEEQSGADL